MGGPMRHLSIVAAMALAASACGTPALGQWPFPENGWFYDNHQLVLMEASEIRAVLSCKVSTLSLQVRDTPPVQAFPQPPLSLTINKSTWKAIPTAKLVGSEGVLETEFYMTQSVMQARDTLDALKANSVVAVAFNGADRSFPQIPRKIGGQFADYCLKAWDFPMRPFPR